MNPESITPDTTMNEVLAAYPGAQRALFRRYHIGGCSSCAFKPDETLAELCQRNDGLDVSEMIAHLQSSREQDEQLMIDATEVARLLREEAALKLLDIRTREEWDAVHVQGAVRMSQESMRDILAKASPEDLLVIMDHQGKQSLDAAAYFQGQGMKNVRCLRGGIDAWSQEVDSSLPRYELT